MNKIIKGDIVSRKSYNNDIFFMVKNIKNKREVVLEGVFERIIADSDINDLNKIDIQVVEIEQKKREKKINTENRILDEEITGKILHLDGDKKYSEKSTLYYKKMGVRAIVKNISERKQPIYVYNLLKYYKPDILVITGHDAMIRKEKEYYNLQNYRNSKYFIETIKQARKFEMDFGCNLVIFAGACQSFFEALMEAGANFASSPARILIDIMDPLIVAKTVATTDEFKFINIDDIEQELRDGRKGIGGIGAKR